MTFPTFQKKACRVILLRCCCFVLILLLEAAVAFDREHQPLKPKKAKPSHLPEHQPPDYIYKDSDPPSDPIIEYHNPNYPDDPASLRPDFLYSNETSYHRVVEFYSPLCPHCRNFAPHYIDFARRFTNLTHDTKSQYAGLDVQFFALSCKTYMKICRQEKVGKYPSFKIIPAHQSSSSSSSMETLSQKELVPLKVLNALGVEAVQDTWEEETKESINKITSNLRVERVEQPGDDNGPHHLIRSQQELFSDAYLSFHTAMTTSVFMQEGSVPGNRKMVLRAFLQLLQDTLPAWRIHSLLGALLNNFAENTRAESKWIAILEQYPPRVNQWSPACQKHDNPYTCGLWTLFHIMTVGVVEFNSGSAVRLTDNKIKIDEAADHLRNYIEHFFHCEECTKHFLQGYDSCAYDRCDRLNYSVLAKKRRGNSSKEKNIGMKNTKQPQPPVMTATEFWAQLPLWSLEFHNGVNVRLQQERYQREHKPHPPTALEEQNVMWPSRSECPACWKDAVAAGAASTYNETIMYNYLKLTYWPEDSSSAATRRQIMQVPVPAAPGEESHQTLSSAAKEPHFQVAFLAVCGVIAWNKKRLEILLGFKKKNEKHNV